jgi:hypothetical protein
MEKIALKNTQQGSTNTYEIATIVPQQLIASNSRLNELKFDEPISVYQTSQVRINPYLFPITINVLQLILYFSNGNGQTMSVLFPNFTQDFNAPVGAGIVIFPIPNVTISAESNQIMNITNTDETASAPDPVLSSWCFTYDIR